MNRSVGLLRKRVWLSTATFSCGSLIVSIFSTTTKWFSGRKSHQWWKSFMTMCWSMPFSIIPLYTSFIVKQTILLNPNLLLQRKQQMRYQVKQQD